MGRSSTLSFEQQIRVQERRSGLPWLSLENMTSLRQREYYGLLLSLPKAVTPVSYDAIVDKMNLQQAECLVHFMEYAIAHASENDRVTMELPDLDFARARLVLLINRYNDLMAHPCKPYESLGVTSNPLDVIRNY